MSVALLLADTPPNLLTYFALVANLPYAMLLDSAATDHVNSRYDILVCEPIATLESTGLHCEIWRQDVAQVRTEQQDPFALLKQLQQQLLPEVDPAHCELPFVGGAVGYLGYDAGRVIEHLPQIASRDIPLPDLAFGIYSWALVLDKTAGQLWYVDVHGATAAAWQQRQLWLAARVPATATPHLAQPLAANQKPKPRHSL